MSFYNVHKEMLSFLRPYWRVTNDGKTLKLIVVSKALCCDFGGVQGGWATKRRYTRSWHSHWKDVKMHLACMKQRKPSPFFHHNITEARGSLKSTGRYSGYSWALSGTFGYSWYSGSSGYYYDYPWHWGSMGICVT